MESEQSPAYKFIIPDIDDAEGLVAIPIGSSDSESDEQSEINSSGEARGEA